METGKVEDTLKQRGEVYGDFGVGSDEFANIMDSIDRIYKDKYRYSMPMTLKIPIVYIVMKLVRLATSPKHLDSWHDIQGYAKLAEDKYREEAENATQNQI